MPSTTIGTNAATDDAVEPASEGRENDDGQCRNCQTELTGNFCHHCGQRAGVQRLNLTTLCKDAVRRALDLDSAYLRTFVAMARHPGHLISAYAAGERKPYANPFKFLLLTITFTTVLRWGAAEVGLWRIVKLDSPEARLLQNHRWLFYTLMQPPLAGALLLLFWRSGRNLAENFAFGLFVGGPLFFYMSIAEFIAHHTFTPVNSIGENVLVALTFVGGLIYAGTGFYDERLVYVIPKMLVAVVVTFTVVAVVLFSLPL